MNYPVCVCGAPKEKRRTTGREAELCSLFPDIIRKIWIGNILFRKDTERGREVLRAIVLEIHKMDIRAITEGAPAMTEIPVPEGEAAAVLPEIPKENGR